MSNALHPAGANAGEMSLGCAGFEIAEHFLLAKQSARRANVVGHEHGGGRAHIECQALQHLADLGNSFAREGEVSPQPLGEVCRDAALDDVTGMFEVGDKGENFRQPAIIVGIEGFGIERRQVALIALLSHPAHRRAV